jgi:hypothetical protein
MWSATPGKHLSFTAVRIINTVSDLIGRIGNSSLTYPASPQVKGSVIAKEHVLGPAQKSILIDLRRAPSSATQKAGLGSGLDIIAACSIG